MILPETEAKKFCFDMITELDNSRLGKILCEPSNGRMFGVLVCTDGTVYRAFSGLLDGKYTSEGFVPPVFDIDAVTETLTFYDNLLKDAPKGKTGAEISRECWEKLKELYRFTCFDGKTRSLKEIFPNAPAGTGDCCAPRLLSHCYKEGKKPLSIAEFYYGNGSKKHGAFYEPCKERCVPILKHILGLDIVYLDSDIVVVNKPAGLLAIEGRSEDKQDCIASRVRNLFPFCINQPCIHRLDQSTEGLMVLGLSKEAHDILSRDFEQRKVSKRYIALVDGKILEDRGIIELPIRLDTENRPHQIPDPVNGKNAITKWEKIRILKYNGSFCTKLSLVPETGRTHQLRVHCAYGLKHPILNDPLYGPCEQYNDSLKLQAVELQFTHPITKKTMSFSLPEAF